MAGDKPKRAYLLEAGMALRVECPQGVKWCLRQERAMTIAFGFQCTQGIAICADRQISKDGMKYYEKKLFSWQVEGCSIAMAYAGYPQFARLVKEEIGEWMRRAESGLGFVGTEDGRIAKDYTAPRLGWFKEFLQGTLDAIYSKYRRDVSLALLCGISTSYGDQALLESRKNVITEPRHDCLGVGDSSLVRYLISLFENVDISAHEALLLGIYLLGQAKKYIEGCGGPTDALILAAGQCREPYSASLLHDAESSMGLAEQETVRLLSNLFDERVDVGQRETSLGTFCGEIRRITNSIRRQLPSV